MAQITPDATLGTESSVVIPNSDSTESISGGATRGANLFHSFEQFSVPPAGAAYFNNTLNIQNIISRVTGTSISNIDGLIQANGTANLFLLNPNGIIFGPNARLNIGGSFLGSTASSINFADGTQFNATEPQSIPLLIVSVPVGLGFGSNPGRILVQGDGQGARTTAELIDTTSGLRVQPNETLALVGGNVALEGATLKTSGGRIELGSVAGSGLVSITPTGKGWELGYTGISTFENIKLSQQASVDASGTGGGDVQVRGRQISITDGSQIEASTLRQEPGGTLNITSLDLVELIGESADGRLISAIATQVYPGATGTGGNLNIETGRLIVRDGAQISASTFGRGNAGFLAVRTSDSVEVTGTTVDFISSGLFSQVSPRASGSGGNLTIETGRLIVRDGAQISAGTSSRGSAGSLSISARNLVEVSGTPTRGRIGSTISTSVEPRATGNGGDLTLETQRLIVRDGATVSSATFGGGQGGTLSVRVEESIELIGSSASGIPSGLSARTGGAGNAGNLNIETGRLSVWDGARVAVNSLDSGTAGRLELKARGIYLNNQGTISAETALSEGGDITLQSQDIQLRNNSAITTTAQGGTGSGGNINIDTDTLVALENSDITANAVQGQGGNIQINTQGIFRSPDSNVTAESGIGLNGVVDIRTLGFDVTNTLTPLAGNLVSTEQIVANSCLTHRNASSGSFVVTGSGGLPTNPYSGIEEWDTSPETQMPQVGVQQQFTLGQITVTAQHKWKVGDPIVEAQGIVKTADGRILLGKLSQGAAPQSAEKLVCPVN